MTPEKHPVSVLWAHPRSMSTAIERLMRQRGDCTCLHEPFMYYYYVHLARKEMPHFKVDASQPTSFTDIVQMFFEQANFRPVFVKDMAYYVLPEILSHPDLATDIRHVFLLRDPHRSIVSYFNLDNNVVSEEIGINAQRQLYEWITIQSGKPPLVLLSDHIQSSPRTAANMLWQYLGLPENDDALEWKNAKAPEEWAQVETWHQKTLLTTSINKDAVDAETARHNFDSLARLNPQLQTLFDDHLEAYTFLRNAGKQQWSGHTERS